MKQICESCGHVIEKPETAYRLRIEMFADPSAPEFTQEDMAVDFEAEMRAIIEEMEATDPEEAEAQVFESYMFTLCSRCRASLHAELRRRHLALD